MQDPPESSSLTPNISTKAPRKYTEADQWHIADAGLYGLSHNSFKRKSRINANDIIPFPPIHGHNREFGVAIPLFVLVLPFTRWDKAEFARTHNLKWEGKGPVNEKLRRLATTTMLQMLPVEYRRWSWISDKCMGIVLASNYDEEELELAFDLDLLDRIRRMMGVSWYPIWTTTDEIKAYDFQIDLPSLPLPPHPPHFKPLADLEWEHIAMILPQAWRQMLQIEKLRKKGTFEPIGRRHPQPISEPESVSEGSSGVYYCAEAFLGLLG